jgi:uncharacterized protein
MQFQQLIDTITPEIYANLKRAIEIGKWPDGRALTHEQRELCMQAIIVYETKNIAAAERTGYIDRGSKVEGELCDDEPPNAGVAPETLKWLE